MVAWFVVLLFSVGALLLFVTGLSLTLMIKGHYIDGEISTNRHMRERGITCVVHDGRPDDATAECGNNCVSCENSPVRSGDSPL